MVLRCRRAAPPRPLLRHLLVGAAAVRLHPNAYALDVALRHAVDKLERNLVRKLLVPLHGVALHADPAVGEGRASPQ